MKENWLEIVQMLRQHFNNNSTEDLYQKEVESCMQLLGWKRYNKSLQTQCVIPIGNNNTIRPDILLSKNNVNSLPIEVKRPSNICNGRQELQLMSYMRMLRVNVGLYIGESISLYYDNPDDSKNAICIYSIQINEEDESGIKLCELLSYGKFDIKDLEDFCRERYNQIIARDNFQQRLSDFLAENNVAQNIKYLIKEKFIKEGYEESVIDNELKNVQLSIKHLPLNNNTHIISSINNRTSIIKTPPITTNYIAECHRERKQYTRTAQRSELIVKFDDGTIIHDKSGIEVEKQFIIKVGIERVRSLGIKQNHEDLIGSPNTCRNPDLYVNRWTQLRNGLYLFNCSNNSDKKKHIERIISSLNIKAKVDIIR